MPSASNIINLLKKNTYSVFIRITGDKSHVKCTLCHHVVNLRQDKVKYSMDEHLKSKKHKEALHEAASGQQTINKLFEAKDQTDHLNYSLVKAFVEAGIPLSKLNHGSIRKFLESALKMKVCDRRHLSKKYLPIIFKESLHDIREIVGDNHVYFIIDESPDVKFRAVVNVMVGVLNGSYVKPMLLMVKHFDKSVNSTMIIQSLNDAANRLWPNGIKYDRIQLVVTDGAAYMKKAFESAPLFPNMIHVTCLAHAIHLVCETIHDNYPLVDQLVSLVKRTLGYSINRRKSFIEIVGKLPPKAVVTRWGTFLDTAEFYHAHLDKVKGWIDQLKDGPAQSISKLKTLRRDVELDRQLLSMQKCFFLKDTITGIEKQGLNIDEQMEFINSIKYSERIPDFIRDAIESCLKKNTGLITLLDKLQNGDDFEFKKRIEFAPLVSCDVERSFSTYKYILSDRRTNLSPQTIEMLNIIMFNRELSSPENITDYFE